ncbi:uncharacterized protein TrAFT101_010133 [Trichoderma asperellum]|uniref:uncharacterized protein n=1 Tax=Trichoderma asperellum TaxID=101201 RepID=UPI003328D072|nr:hypothetical protein TrAFT101_010133 [Trichoderma asperellum]
MGPRRPELSLLITSNPPNAVSLLPQGWSAISTPCLLHCDVLRLARRPGDLTQHPPGYVPRPFASPRPLLYTSF